MLAALTDVPAIVERVKKQCQLIWLENLNLRGSFKAEILHYIRERYYGLLPLYEEIYLRGQRSYWQGLDRELSGWAAERGLEYLHNDDSIERGFTELPIIVNYFFHEEIKKSAAKKQIN